MLDFYLKIERVLCLAPQEVKIRFGSQRRTATRTSFFLKLNGKSSFFGTCCWVLEHRMEACLDHYEAESENLVKWAKSKAWSLKTGPVEACHVAVFPHTGPTASYLTNL